MFNEIDILLGFCLGSYFFALVLGKGAFFTIYISLYEQDSKVFVGNQLIQLGMLRFQLFYISIEALEIFLH